MRGMAQVFNAAEVWGPLLQWIASSTDGFAGTDVDKLGAKIRHEVDILVANINSGNITCARLPEVRDE